MVFRHGSPPRWLPHQIPYRAQALALRTVGVRSALVTSSVGLLQPELPAFVPMLLRDLVWLDNRLPDGTPATVFREPSPDQGHLLLEEGLFSPALGAEVRRVAETLGAPLPARELTFWYAPGPRTKTRAENALLAALGLDANSMTLAPEVVLLNELGIACAGLVVGHKASTPDQDAPDGDAIRRSLVEARRAVRDLVLAFLRDGSPVACGNRVYRHD